RSMLQREDSLTLFRFATEGPHSLSNNGSHIFSKYSLTSGQWVGQISEKGLSESIRLTSRGRLLTKLIFKEKVGKKPTTLAFSRCQKSTRVSKLFK
ncbi:MAG: hypothetical protein AAF202_03145, partial [Pseudomonadota bacterium]